MCGRYTDTKRDKQFLARMGLHPELEFLPRYNVAPTQEATIIVAGANGMPELKRARWGLVPPWAKDEKIGNTLVNARCETLAVRPAFRYSFRKKRCLVLADGFYEWQKLPGGKQPVYIRLKGARQFAFAGLWETWKSAAGEVHTFCVITVTPNELVSRIHDRMPLILPEEALMRWLNPETSPAEVAALLEPYSAEEMELYPVSKLVNSAVNERPECIQRLEAVPEIPVEKEPEQGMLF